MPSPDHANSIQQKKKKNSFTHIHKLKNRSRDSFKTLAKQMIAQEPNVLLEETWN